MADEAKLRPGCLGNDGSAATSFGRVRARPRTYSATQSLVWQLPSYFGLFDALDRQPATLEIANNLSSDYPEIFYREANILEWNSGEAYDIVLCTLALHHFSDDDAVTVLRRCRELCRGFVLVSDLRRGFLLQAGVYLLTALIFREPMTRHDARLSAVRAFSFSEMRDLALCAGWKHFGHKKFRFARQAIWLEKQT